MILIVALDLFVHKTAVVDGLEVSSTNIVQDRRMVIGESAVYSALLIKTMQGEPFVIGATGGIGGRFIKNFMDKNKIKSDFIWKETETRSVLKIIDSVNMTETILLDDDFSYSEVDLKHLKHKFIQHSKDIDTVIINDYSNNELTFDIVQELTMQAKENNMRVVLSLSGDKLRKALELRPYAVAVHVSDLKELGIPHQQEEPHLIQSLYNLAMKNGIKYLVYDNDDYVCVITHNKVCYANYKTQINKEEILATKDVIIGALAISIARKYELEKMSKWIAAARGAVSMDNYPKLCKRKEMDDLYNKIKLVEYPKVEWLKQ